MMKTVLIYLFLASSIFAQPFIKQQVVLEGNNIRSYILNSGVFNQDIRTNNTPGFEWPKGTGKFACFTAGFNVGAYINNSLRMSAASYSGEYRPGYSENGMFYTDARFRIYKVKRGDNYINNPDWLNWGLMVQYGAPFTDINNNGTYEYFVDIPGFKGAAETVFINLTDGDSTRHTPSEGFGGGTVPLYANVSITAWCFDTLVYKDMQFFKWRISNGSASVWDSTVFSIFADPDLGDATDDYIGCDTLKDLAYVYNADNIDGDGSGVSYGINPPAWGVTFLNCLGGIPGSTGFIHLGNSTGPPCEGDASNAVEAYWFMKGFKSDGTPWVNITNNAITKFPFSGDPESGSGCTMYSGRINNCDGSITGTTTIPIPPGDRTFVFSTKPQSSGILPGGSVDIYAAQIVARGLNNKNSVTLLKELSDSAKGLCQNGFVIGIQPVSTLIPSSFKLHQNYPNPFNPVTKIRFDVPKTGFTLLKIYDALGKEVGTLLNEELRAGEYSVDWNASNYPSGVYFYSLQSGKFKQTKKMLLIK